MSDNSEVVRHFQLIYINEMTIEKKSFWQRPEGVTGAMVMVGAIAGGAYLVSTFAAVLLSVLSTTIGLIGMVMLMAAILFVLVDKQARNLFWYGYKSIMRWITGLFIQMDPVSILKSYLEDMKANLRNMSKQIGGLRGQMRSLRNTIEQNNKGIKDNMRQAQMAKQNRNEAQMVLKSRKVGRLQESNARLETLYQKMEVLYRILTKMHQSSEIVYEDTRDQIKIKEQESIAIRASHSAIKSAMNVINGNSDRRLMFDQAMEALAEDVATKVGEMERFMDVSSNFMNTIDLQNGVFEEEGLKMLAQWEKQSIGVLLGEEKAKLLNNNEHELDINMDVPKKNPVPRAKGNQYTNLFD